MLRAGCEPVMVPKELLLVVVLGALKFTWLKALNASAVNHSRLRSPSLKILRKDMFQLFQAGPMIVPMPALPTAVAGAWQTRQLTPPEGRVVLNHLSGPR